MTGAFRGAPTFAAKPLKTEASHTKPEGALLQLKEKKGKNEGEKRRRPPPPPPPPIIYHTLPINRPARQLVVVVK